MRRFLTLLVAIATALVVAQGAFADNKHGNTGKSKGKGPPAEQSAGGVLAQAMITAAEIAVFDRYIERNGVQAFGPPQGLPPGIAKNLARGKPLPPGIAKRYLPQGLLSQLPPRPGYEWLAVDRDILLVVAATGVIVDILKGAL